MSGTEKSLSEFIQNPAHISLAICECTRRIRSCRKGVFSAPIHSTGVHLLLTGLNCDGLVRCTSYRERRTHWRDAGSPWTPITGVPYLLLAHAIRQVSITWFYVMDT